MATRTRSPWGLSNPRADCDWRELAACRQVDPDCMYPTSNPLLIAAAKQVCARCPVVAQCLTAGIREQHGVWGGLTEQERRRLPRSATPHRQVTNQKGQTA